MTVPPKISQRSPRTLDSNSTEIMKNILENIARENFRTSGYITRPRRDRPTAWTFSSPPRSPFYTTNSVRDALQRRERAHRKSLTKPSFFKNWIDVFLHR